MHTQNSPSNEGCGGPKETEQQSFLEKPVQKPGRKKVSIIVIVCRCEVTRISIASLMNKLPLLCFMFN